ncbi:MAG: hypothetical protein JWL62_1154, partial [Hyphomicrobiales bacterium]|nr:hypothetical protein [Hyphomicrobiales bacterium]
MTLVRNAFAVAAAFAASTFCASANAEEVRVFAAGAVQGSISQIVTAFEKETGNKVIATYGTAGAVETKIAAGEPADIALSSLKGLHGLADDGKVASDYPKVVGRVRIAVAVKTGSKKPDISKPEKLRAVLLSTPSFGYADPASGATTGIFFAKVLNELGITDEVKSKAVLRKGGLEVMKEVVNGTVAMGFGQASEIVPVPGVEIAGFMPDTMQLTGVYAASLTKAGAKSAAAKDLFA